jgi:hypothetical protein
MAGLLVVVINFLLTPQGPWRVNPLGRRGKSKRLDRGLDSPGIQGCCVLLIALAGGLTLLDASLQCPRR